MYNFTLSRVEKAVIHDSRSRDCGCKPLGRYPLGRAAADLNSTLNGQSAQLRISHVRLQGFILMFYELRGWSMHTCTDQGGVRVYLPLTPLTSGHRAGVYTHTFGSSTSVTLTVIDG